MVLHLVLVTEVGSVSDLLLPFTRSETHIFLYLPSSDAIMTFFCGGSKWRSRALLCDLISSISCCSQSELSAQRKRCVCFQKRTVNSISCFCSRKIVFMINLLALFKFVKVPSITHDRATFKIGGVRRMLARVSVCPVHARDGGKPPQAEQSQTCSSSSFNY